MKTYIQPVVELIGMNTESLIALSRNDAKGGTELTRQKVSWDAAAWEDEDEMDLVEE